jgi:hypothetical protein
VFLPSLHYTAAAKYEAEYLQEPTKEFLELNEQQAAFAKKMRAYKAEWSTAEAVVVNADTDDAVSAGLVALQVSALFHALFQLLSARYPCYHLSAPRATLMMQTSSRSSIICAMRCVRR